jgi:hypothetical protein
MANVKITDLASGTALTGAELFEMVQSTFSKKTTATEIANTANNVRTVATGGTGVSATPANGQLLIGNGSGFTLASLTAGTNITIVPSSGGITINSTGGGGGGSGTVTSVSGSGGTTGLTLTGGPITASGTLTLGGTLIASNGGTGQSTYSVGDLLYADSSTSLNKLADVATGNALISGGVGVAPSWGKIGLTTHISGTLPIANGGTNATSVTNARINLLPSYAGNGGRVLAVNAGASDIEWISVSGVGTVTSVAVSGGSTGLTTSGGPITGSGTITLAGTLATGSGGTGSTTVAGARVNLLPSYTGNNGRVLAVNSGSSDVEWISVGGSGTVTSVAVSGGSTGLNTSGGPITGSGTITLSGTLNPANGGTGAITLTGVVIGNGTSAFTTVSAPAGSIVGTSDTQTLTNKRITPRATSLTTTTSPWAWSSDSYDIQAFTALDTALTINADGGTPTDGQKTVFRFKDNGTQRNLVWTTAGSKSFRAVGVTLPTTTIFTGGVSKTVYVGCIYNENAGRWDAVAVSQEA